MGSSEQMSMSSLDFVSNDVLCFWVCVSTTLFHYH